MKAGGRFIGLTPDEVAKVSAKHNFLKPITVPAGAYEGQKEPVNSVGSWSYILARTDLPDDVAYRLAKALHQGHPALVKRLAQGRETTPQNTKMAAPKRERHPSRRAELPARNRALVRVARDLIRKPVPTFRDHALVFLERLRDVVPDMRQRVR